MISHPKNELFDTSTLKKLGTVDEVCSLGWEISFSFLSHPREELLVLIKWNAGVAAPGMNRDTTRAHLTHPFRHNRRSTSLDFQTNAGAHKHSPCRQRLLWRSSSSLPFFIASIWSWFSRSDCDFSLAFGSCCFCCVLRFKLIPNLRLFCVVWGSKLAVFLSPPLLTACLFVCLCGELFTVVVFVWVRRESFCVLLQQSGFLSFFLSFVIVFSNSQRFL